MKIYPGKNQLLHLSLKILLIIASLGIWGIKGQAQNNFQRYILTPSPPAKPRINGPKIYGARPNAPFIYRIPCTGVRPVTFTATGLPEGLNLDKNSGIISGTVAQKGEYVCQFKAQNRYGSSERIFKIEIGNKLALTPPMGWNSWYIYYNRVSDQIMRKAANQMVASGMADYGYQYVNSDDCWDIKVGSDDPVIGGPVRDSKGDLIANRRFPDMKGLTDYIHSRGLKAGIYISPGPRTCAGYEGSYGHVKQDAQTFADWGFDFLKYDWCSYGKYAGGKSREDYMRPYKMMWDALQNQNRNIVLNLCQYGMDSVWKWGASVGNCWRTTGDLGQRGPSHGLPGFYQIGFSNAQHWRYAGPGGW
ncbi:MAG: putative Ig domain-containing protein, partial [Candidatus Saccharimonadales bacterium]